MKTIVALVDLSTASAKVLSHATTMAHAFGSELVVMHVVPLVPVTAVSYGAEMPSIPLEPSPEAVHADRAKLDHLVSSLTHAGIKARALQFQGPVAETLIEETEKLNADLAIMGTHHHGMLYNLFIGSVAADVLKRLSFPVLVVPWDPENGKS